MDRNSKGKKYEKQGKIEQAKKLYELNITEEFEGDFPYNRLAVLYRKEKDLKNEIRVLEKAIHVFYNLSDRRPDKPKKLKAFQERLSKLK